MALFAALALLPDADVLLVALGAHDAGAFGHRGGSHSLSVALVVGLLSAFAARRLGWPVLRTALAATLAVASHAFLDVLDQRGRGLPLFWPLSSVRFHSPWRIFPDAPRGLKLFSSAGLASLAIELTLFLPVIGYAVWPHLAERVWRWRRPQPQLSIIAGGGPTRSRPRPRQGAAPTAQPLPTERDPALRSSG